MTKKIAALGLVLAMVVSFVGPSVAGAETTAELNAEIVALQAQLNALLAQLSGLEGVTPASTGVCPSACSNVTGFTRNLSLGATGNDVKCLQAMLNMDSATQVASSGVGSQGNETSYYGNLTKAAVVKFQNKYASEILASWGLTSGTGFFGSTSRAKMDALLAACGEEEEPVVSCADHSVQDDCEAGDCYWYDAACHEESEAEATCPDYTTESTCTAGACYWYDSVCNAEEEEVPVAAGLTVALASDTPSATTLADGTAFNNMLKLKFTAGSEGAVNVTGLKVTKGGISADTYVEGILIVDSDGNRHGAIVTSLAADSTASLVFSDDAIVVPAGTSVYATVQVNLGASFGSGTINVKVASPTDVTSGASSVSGTFPVMSNTMSVVDGAATVGSLYVDAIQFHSNGTDDATVVSVNLGTTDQILGKIELTESTANENVQVEKITIYNNGNTTDVDIANIDLVAPDGTVLATLPSLTNRYGTFDLSSSPYIVSAGTTKILTLRCDIISGSTRTVRLLVENDYDVVVKGVSSGTSLLAAADSAGTDRAFPIGDQATVSTNYMNKVTIASGSLSVSKATSSPSGTIAVGSTNQTLAEFKITASGEDMRLERVNLQITTPDPDATYELTGTVKIQDESGVTLWSLVATTDSLYEDGTPVQRTLSTRKTIAAGTSEVIRVVADISSSATTAFTYQVSIKDLYAKRMSSGDYVTYATSYVNANTLTVSTSALTLAKNDAYGNTVEVAGGSKVKIASFVIQAGSAEAINISSFKVTLTPTGGAIGDYTNVIVEKGDGTQLGSTVVAPAAAGDTLSISGFQVASSSSEIVNIYSDITSDASTGESVVVTLGTFGATGVTSTTTITSPTATTGQTITWAASGALTVSTDTSTPGVAVLHANESKVTVLKFILASYYEAINVTRIVLDASYGAANLSQVYLYDAGTDTLLGSTSLSGGQAIFSGLSLQVAKDGGVYLTVKVDTTSSGTLISAQDMRLVVSDVDSTGAGSGVVIYPSGVTTETSNAADDIVANTATETVNVDSTAGITVGDVVELHSTAGSGTYTVGAVNSATSLDLLGPTAQDNIPVDSWLTLWPVAAKTQTSTASDDVTTNAASAIGVDSTAGFAVGDVVFLNAVGDGGGRYIVTAITSGTNITILGTASGTLTDIPADSWLTKIATSATTQVATAAALTQNTASTLTVDSTTGFVVGDVIAVHSATTGSGVYTVTVVSSATAMTVVGSAATFTPAVDSNVAKLSSVAATQVATAATLTANTAGALVVDSNSGFAEGDVVYINSTVGGAIYMVTATSGSTGITFIGASTLTTIPVDSWITKIWSLAGVSSPFVLHDVEPVIALNAASPSGTGSASTLETVAIFNVTAFGTRPLMIESLTFYRGGSTTTEVASSSTPMVYAWSNGTVGSLLGTGDTWSGTGVAAGDTSLVNFATPQTVNAGQTVSFAIRVNTSGIVTVNKTFQVYIDGTAGVKTAANAGIDWYYTAGSPSPGTEPTEASPASYCDSYPVYGNNLRY